MGKVFGIDLGTTYSCIAFIDETGEPMVLKNAEDQLTTPSVVYFEDAQTVMVGDMAKEEAILHPLQSVSLIKREMGQEGRTRTINGTEMRPEEISSFILKKLVQDAQNTLANMGKLEDGEEIRDVVITCPAYFGTSEREATKNAGILAGLNVLAIINEPTAAAIDYGISAEGEEKTILVYDLGGGTFDVTIMKIGKKKISAVATGGNSTLGGADWDQEIITYVAAKFEEETGVSTSDFLGNPETLQQLSINVEKAKKMLTAKAKAPIVVDYDGQHLRLELTREEFDNLTMQHLNHTIEVTESVIREYEAKGYSRKDISEILLVGGSTKMPQVKTKVEEAFGIPSRSFNPDEAVARGASRYANSIQLYMEYIKNGEDDETEDDKDKKKNPEIIHETEWGLPGQETIVDVTSRTYGLMVQVQDHGTEEEKCRIANIIFKNTELPHDVTTTQFGPRMDNQPCVLLKVYESLSNDEMITMDMGVYVGEAKLILPPHTKRGDKFEITFHLDNNGLLKMHAKELKTGNTVDAVFEVSKSMSEEEIEEVKERVSAVCIS